MRDYHPLDLSAYCQSDVRSLISNQEHPSGELPRGELAYHGLPFKLGGKDGQVLGLGEGLGLDSVSVPIGDTARFVIAAHRLIDSKIAEGDPVGRVCADYRFRFHDGQEVSVPIRERLEIGIIPFPWGQVAMLAQPDEKDYLWSRHVGNWAERGRRRAEAFQGWPKHFYLYAWKNPRPEQRIESLTIEPKGPRFVVLGVTLGHLEEYPFNRHAKLDVKLTLERKEDAERPFDLAVEVDRGVATFPYPLPSQSAAEFLEATFTGFGQEANKTRSPAYTQIAANPSATISVKQGEELIGSARWSELLEKKTLNVDSRLRIELVDKGRNWVHTTVVDDETNQPIPCRVHFRSPDGIPYQPHGYHQHVNAELESWLMGYGGDMKLGHATYAYISGKCQGWLPRGEVIVDIARGFEYQPLRTKVELRPGERELTFRLKRFRNMNQERYFSGDTHVHLLSTQGAHLEASGEDLNVVNLLQSQWGHLFTDTQEFTGRPSVAPDGKTIVYATQENRQHILGHLILLGLKEPVMPFCTDGPSEAELGGNMETTVSRWADACHEQDGTVILPHMPNPNCEPAVLVVTGRIDAMEMCAQDSYSIGEYYKYLNCGYRMPLTGGTDKMSADVPVGLYRTYVHIPADEPFDYETWCKHLRGGNTFLSAGPLMSFSVEGRPIGSTLELPGNGGELEIEASAESALPFYCLEIVVNGAVVARTEEGQAARKLHLREKIRVDKHSWIAARCAGPGFSKVKHHDGWRRGVMSHTSPIYVSVGGPWWMFDVETAEYLLTLIHGGLDHIKHKSTQWEPGSVTHHHAEADHMKYLEAPFQDAIRILHQRMHQRGIPH